MTGKGKRVVRITDVLGGRVSARVSVTEIVTPTILSRLSACWQRLTAALATMDRNSVTTPLTSTSQFIQAGQRTCFRIHRSS